MPQNYKLHMHTLDFEASFTELSLLEERNLMPQTILRKENAFSLQGETLGVQLGGAIPPEVFPYPHSPGEIFPSMYRKLSESL